MKRTHVALLLVGLLGLLAAGLAGVYLVGRRTPTFYAEAIKLSPPPEVRQRAVAELVRETARLADEIRHAPQWSAEFTDTQVNAWLIDEFPNHFPEAIPPEVRDPRVKFNTNQILVGFRYHGPRDGEHWNGVVSVAFEPTLFENGTLAIRIVSAQAGLIPLPLHETLEEVFRNIRLSDWNLRWVTENGEEILLVDLDSTRDMLLDEVYHGDRLTPGELPTGPNNERLQTDASLESVEVHEGVLRIAGRRMTAEGQIPSADPSQETRVTQLGTASAIH